MELKKSKQSVKEKRESESLKAEVAKQAALIEYFAILNGVDLGENDETEEDEI